MRTRRRKLSGCGVLALLVITSGLTGCATGLSGSKGSPASNIYQPPVLVLPAGQPVRTEMGVYTPEKREIWHSQARFRELELQVQDLAAALAQERARAK